MSPTAKEVVECNEDPKQGKRGETFELSGDKKSVVNEAETASAAMILAIWLCRWRRSSCSSIGGLGSAGLLRGQESLLHLLQAGP